MRELTEHEMAREHARAHGWGTFGVYTREHCPGGKGTIFAPRSAE